MRSKSMLAVAAAGLFLMSAARTTEEPHAADSEVAHAAQHYGLDYAALREKARADENAARGLFLLDSVMDGAAAETCSDDVMAILEGWGDDRAVKLVQSVTKDLQDNVLREVAFQKCYFEGPEKEWRQFKRTMPKLAALVESRLKRPAKAQ